MNLPQHRTAGSMQGSGSKKVLAASEILVTHAVINALLTKNTNLTANIQ